MVGLDQQSAPKQLINGVPSHVVLVGNKIGAYKNNVSVKDVVRLQLLAKN